MSVLSLGIAEAIRSARPATLRPGGPSTLCRELRRPNRLRQPETLPRCLCPQRSTIVLQLLPTQREFHFPAELTQFGIRVRSCNELQSSSHRLRNPRSARLLRLFQKLGRNFDRNLSRGFHVVNYTILNTSIEYGISGAFDLVKPFACFAQVALPSLLLLSFQLNFPRK